MGIQDSPWYYGSWKDHSLSSGKDMKRVSKIVERYVLGIDTLDDESAYNLQQEIEQKMDLLRNWCEWDKVLDGRDWYRMMLLYYSYWYSAQALYEARMKDWANKNAN